MDPRYTHQTRRHVLDLPLVANEVSVAIEGRAELPVDHVTREQHGRVAGGVLRVGEGRGLDELLVGRYMRVEREEGGDEIHDEGAVSATNTCEPRVSHVPQTCANKGGCEQDKRRGRAAGKRAAASLAAASLAAASYFSFFENGFSKSVK